MFKKIRKFKNSKRRSTGSVCVEFAFVAPIFFLLVIGSIEFARVHMIQSAVENACFEGARRGIVPVQPMSYASNEPSSSFKALA